VSQIIADTMDEMGLKLPPTRVDIADIRRKFHAVQHERQTSAALIREREQGTVEHLLVMPVVPAEINAFQDHRQ
jgi:hypothetical protein